MTAQGADAPGSRTRMTKRVLAVHLPPAIFDELEEVGVIEGSGMEEFVRIALEEKLADLRTAQYFRERGPWRCVPGVRRPRRRHRTAPSAG